MHEPPLFKLFKDRGYAIAELNNVLYRRLEPTHEPPLPNKNFEIRRSPAEESDLTGAIVENAFFPDGAPESFRGLMALLY